MKKSKVKWRGTILFLLMFFLLSVSASAETSILISGGVFYSDNNKLIRGSKVKAVPPATLNIAMCPSNNNSVGVFLGTAMSAGKHKVKVKVGTVTRQTELKLRGSCCQVRIKWDRINKKIVRIIPRCK